MADTISAPAQDDDRKAGRPGLAPELFSQVYESLRQLARQRMAEERAGHTLQATALVHEVYIRLSKDHEIRWDGPAHFYAAAAEAMRRILIEHARARGRVKRGDQRRRLPMDVLDLATAPDPQEILTFDDALCRLEKESPETLAVVRMRFFAGLSVQETADVLRVSARTVNREWTYARAWLYRELEQDRG